MFSTMERFLYCRLHYCPCRQEEDAQQEEHQEMDPEKKVDLKNQKDQLAKAQNNP